MITTYLFPKAQSVDRHVISGLASPPLERAKKPLISTAFSFTQAVLAHLCSNLLSFYSRLLTIHFGSSVVALSNC